MKLKEMWNDFVKRAEIDMCISSVEKGNQIKYRIFDDKNSIGELVDFPFNFRVVPTANKVWSFAKENYFEKCTRVDLCIMQKNSEELVDQFTIFKSKVNK